MIDPLKIVVCFLKLVKTTPRHPKGLPDHEYTRFPTHQGVDFLVYFEQASEQVYKKKFWWQTDQGVKNPQGSLGYLVYFARKQFQIFSNIHGIFLSVIDSPAKYAWGTD
jgi:hypothetical protein